MIYKVIFKYRGFSKSSIDYLAGIDNNLHQIREQIRTGATFPSGAAEGLIYSVEQGVIYR